mgnify:CR=1 FL=1
MSAGSPKEGRQRLPAHSGFPGAPKRRTPLGGGGVCVRAAILSAGSSGAGGASWPSFALKTPKRGPALGLPVAAEHLGCRGCVRIRPTERVGLAVEKDPDD